MELQSEPNNYFPFVLDVTDSVLWEVDVENQEVRLFGSVERLLGNDGQREFELQTFVDSYVHPVDVDRVVDAVEAVHDDPTLDIDVEYRIKRDMDDGMR
jgi:hypothetical protein